MVVLKELIFYTVSMLEECGGLERTEFLHIYNFNGLIFYSFYFQSVVVLKELIFYSVYFGRLWWS